MSGYSPLDGGGLQRTDMRCTNCSKDFVAELDFSINGEHIIECPHCGHEHWRKIEAGKITEARWGAGDPTHGVKVNKRSVWKSSVLKAQTSTVSHHLRDLWLNRSDHGA